MIKAANWVIGMMLLVVAASAALVLNIKGIASVDGCVVWFVGMFSTYFASYHLEWAMCNDKIGI